MEVIAFVFLCFSLALRVRVHAPPPHRRGADGHNDGLRGQQQHLGRGEAAGLHRRSGRGLLDRPDGLQRLAVLEEKKEEGAEQLRRYTTEQTRK